MNMGQYIPKSVVLDELKRRRDAALERQKNLEAIGQESVINEMVANELNIIIASINHLEVKEVDKEVDLEEASRNYADNEEYGDDVYFAIKAAFEAGAEWKKEHFWKPSKEQIEALEHSLGDYNIKIFEDRYEILKSLYNDLKKLKEE